MAIFKRVDDKTSGVTLFKLGRLTVLSRRTREESGCWLMQWRLFDSVGIFRRTVRLPKRTDNTFLLWEPCTHSHAEVLPGFAQYLLDLGFDVSVIASQTSEHRGLFGKMSHPGLFVNDLSKREAFRFMRMAALPLRCRGLMVTSAGIGLNEKLNLLHRPEDFARVVLVEHRAPALTEHPELGCMVMLRRVTWPGISYTVVNPHSFGLVVPAPKNPRTRFISIGALRSHRRNPGMLIDAVAELHRRNVRDFEICIVGKGSLRGIPDELRGYFRIMGRLDFAGLYAELEKSDFFLPLLDADNPVHEKYIRTGTSGSFQLIYGFGKIPVIVEKYAPINGFDATNSIIYRRNSDLADAMAQAIALPQGEYEAKQRELRQLAERIYAESRENLRQLAL